MDQQINLYQLQAKVEKEPLMFRQILQILGIFVLLLLLYTIMELYRVVSTKKELSELEKKQLEYSKQLQITSSGVAPKQTRENLEKELKNLQEIQAQESLMISKLKNIQIFSNKGFSNYLIALSEHTVPGLWLTEFNFKNQNEIKYIKLKGRALSPELIPKFIDILSREEVFEGNTFEVFSLVQAEQDEKDKTKTTVQTKARTIEMELEPQGYDFILETVANKL